MTGTIPLMENDFWQQRWRENRIGFHKNSIHPGLQTLFPEIGLSPGSGVFVPLCGKSLDLLWLHNQGYSVTGVEVSPVAVDAFFSENSLTPDITEVRGFSLYEIPDLRLWCGDFFALQAGDIPNTAAVYDRAALIALPVAMRREYVDHLLAILPAAMPILLVTLEYPQQQMTGPPFSVVEDEIRELFSATADIQRVQADDILQQENHFRNQGLTSLTEVAYRITVAG